MTKTRPPDPLGAMQRVYRSRPLSRSVIVRVLLPGLLLAAGLAAWGARRAYLAYGQYGPAAAQAWSRPWFIAAGVVLGLILIGSLVHLLNRGLRLDVHAAGLRLFHFGRLYRTLPYAEISGVYTAIYQDRLFGWALGTQWWVALQTGSAPPLALSQAFQDLPELVTQIKEQVYLRLLPAYQAALRSGQQVDLGPLSFSLQELRVGRNTRPWRDVRSVDVQNGYLIIQYFPAGQKPDKLTTAAPATGRRERISIARLPNLELLFILIHQGELV